MLAKKENYPLQDMIFAFFVIFAFIILPETSFAAPPELATEQGSIAFTICSIINELQGPIARGVAAFGIIFLGFSLFLGKISWGVGLALGIGLGAIFGAPDIVAVIGDGQGACDGIAGN